MLNAALVTMQVMHIEFPLTLSKCKIYSESLVACVPCLVRLWPVVPSTSVHLFEQDRVFFGFRQWKLSHNFHLNTLNSGVLACTGLKLRVM